MKNLFKQITFKIARSKPGGWIVWFILRYFPFLIPFKRLYQDQFIISIFHPVPCYENHILLLPRIFLPDFLALDSQSDTGKKFIQSVYQAMQAVLVGVELTNIQLLINGGDYQDVRLLHMHLLENEFDVNNSQMIKTEDNNIELSNLFLQAQERIQNTKHIAYRLIFFFNENDNMLFHLEIKLPPDKL